MFDWQVKGYSIRSDQDKSTERIFGQEKIKKIQNDEH